MSTERIERIKDKLAAKRTAEKQEKVNSAEAKALREERGMKAAAAWSSIQILMPQVAADLNEELGADAPPLSVAIEPAPSDWLGKGYVAIGESGSAYSPASAKFTINLEGDLEILMPGRAGLQLKRRHVNIAEMTKEDWRDILLEYYESRL